VTPSPQDLSSTHADIAITLNGLSQIVTHDLARDLSPELIGLLNHSRPNIRKRATVALYKIMIEYPELTEVGITRMREKLEDSDPCNGS
jgi:AP-3 complex subunit delta-1